MDLPTSQKAARAIGASKYLTGKPCKRGHISPRYVASGNCCDCLTEYNKGRGEYHRWKAKAWRYRILADPIRGPEQRRYERANGKVRKRRVRNATPAWADLNAIRQFALNCPPGMHIDHIIPIKGHNVCGLHVLENLQYLPHDENRAKYNHVDPLTLEFCVCPVNWGK